MDDNPKLRLEISMRRNHHPYMASTYVNGYVKEQPLRNMALDQIMHYMTKVSQEYGRKPLKHNNGNVIMQETKSVQGQWQDNMWNHYPKHFMEPTVVIPVDRPLIKPSRRHQPKRVMPHHYTKLARKKPVLIDRYSEPNPEPEKLLK